MPDPMTTSARGPTWVSITSAPLEGNAPSATESPCVVVAPSTGDFVPRVEQVWPGSPSAVSGFRSAVLTRPGCRRSAPKKTAACDIPFPWGLAGTDPESQLSTSGGERLRWGFLRGAPAAKPGTTVEPLEFWIYVFDGWESAGAPPDGWLVAGARKCGRPTTVGGLPAFVTTRSSEGATATTGLLVIDSGAVTWLDFTEGPWTEAERLRVAALVVAQVARSTT